MPEKRKNKGTGKGRGKKTSIKNPPEEPQTDTDIEAAEKEEPKRPSVASEGASSEKSKNAAESVAGSEKSEEAPSAGSGAGSQRNSKDTASEGAASAGKGSEGSSAGAASADSGSKGGSGAGSGSGKSGSGSSKKRRKVKGNQVNAEVKLPPITEEAETQAEIEEAPPREEGTQTQATDVPPAEGEPEKTDVFDLEKFLDPEGIKTVTLSKKWRQPPGPVASKVVYFDKPKHGGTEDEEFGEEPGLYHTPGHEDEPETHFAEDIMLLFEDHLPEETPEDRLIDLKLTQLIDIHRGEVTRKLRQAKKPDVPKFTFAELMNGLKDLGIPCPTSEDYSRLYSKHSRWDPDGTVVEYFSPVLRTFIPINMRGRYRGCWNTDDCMKGLDISKVPPKQDALEGFVQRGRHDKIQEKFDDMAPVALDEEHLDYLIDIQTYQAQTLPIPIFYDMLHLGLETTNETLQIFVQEEGYPPHNPIFISAQDHAEQLRRKIQLYGALGLEQLESRRRGLGQFLPQWLKTRDEVIRQIMRSKDNERYQKLQDLEKEANERGEFRRATLEKEMENEDAQVSQKRASKPSEKRTSKASVANISENDKTKKKRTSKVAPETQA